MSGLKIEYVESGLVRLIKHNEQNAIYTVTCSTEKFEELFKEAKELDLLDKSDDYWFSLKNIGFSNHLDSTM